VLAQDETDLLLCPPLRKQWARQGQPACVLLGGGNARRVISGAMNLGTGHRLWLPRRRQRAEDFQAFLRQVHARYRGWQVLLLVDRDASHTAHQSIRLAQQLKIRLLWLPTRCPELNPMEALWGHAKNVVSANQQCANRDRFDCQVKRFTDYLSALTAKQALQTAGMFYKNFWLHRIVSIKFCQSGSPRITHRIDDIITCHVGSDVFIV
jgi:transposase